MPSERRCLRLTSMRKASRNASLPGQSRIDVGARKEALHRCFTQFTVHGAVIFLGDPGLGGEVQLFEGESGLAFEHGEEASLDAAPQVFLLAVDVRRVRQRR